MKNFWEKLNKPFFCLAPMADVTDVAFRQIIAKCSRHGKKNGGPQVFWTEFVSADGLAHPNGRVKLMFDLKFSGNEHPIVAQLFGSNPENMKNAAKLCRKLGFDGIDINMGCPDKSIEKQNAGAAMIKNPGLAKKILYAAREGAKDIPVSVKTRIGYNKNEIETWIRFLLEENLPALAIHLRTRKEMSLVPAHWEYMKRIIEIRDEIWEHKGGNGRKTLIIGNGDIFSLDQGRVKINESGCDGIMIGKGIFGNPWLFLDSKSTININDRLLVLVEHMRLFEKKLGRVKSFHIMKKHFKAYIGGFDGAKELRADLMGANTAKEAEGIIMMFLEQKNCI